MYSLFLSLCFFTVFASSAQINKGAMLLGVNFSGATTNITTEGNTIGKMKLYSVSPAFGKAIKQNLMVGIDATIIYGKFNGIPGNPTNDKQNGYGAGIFLRKYKQLGKSDFSIFLNNRLEFDYTKKAWLDMYDKYVTKRNWNQSGRLSRDILFNYKSFQLESGFLNNILAVNYSVSKTNATGVYPYNNKRTDFSLLANLNNFSQIYIGFRILLNKAWEYKAAKYKI